MAATEEKEIIKKLSEIGDQIKHVQDTNDRLKKDYDGLDLTNIKENAEKAAQGLEEVQELKQKVAALDYKDRFEAIELAIAKSTGKLDEDGQKAYKQAMTYYMRRNAPIPDDIVDMLCEKQASMQLLGIGEKERVDYLKKDLVAASGPDGGYFILPDRASTISTRIFESSPLRPVCEVVTTTSDTWEQVLDDDEFGSGWVGEVEARPTTTTGQVGLIQIPVHEGYAKPRATQKMLDDAGFDIEAWVNRKVSAKLSRQENTSFVVGNGSKKPKGFLTYPAWAVAGTYERDAVEQITATGTAGTLDESNDLITLQNSLIEELQAGAGWAMNRTTFTAVMQLQDTTGQYLLNPRILKEGTDKMLLGKNVIFMTDMPTVAANALAVIYANWMEFYTIVDRLGIRVLRDPYTEKPYVLFYTTKRVGGAVTNFQAGKILKINA